MATPAEELLDTNLTNGDCFFSQQTTTAFRGDNLEATDLMVRTGSMRKQCAGFSTQAKCAMIRH